MADPEEAVLQVAVAAGDGDAVPVAEGEPQLGRVDALRREDPGDDRRAVLVGREQLEAHRLRALAAGAAEPDVAVERRLEPLLEQQPERDVQRLARARRPGVNALSSFSWPARVRSQS